jgi:hypothetical protein
MGVIAERNFRFVQFSGAEGLSNLSGEEIVSMPLIGRQASCPLAGGCERWGVVGSGAAFSTGGC